MRLHCTHKARLDLFLLAVKYLCLACLLTVDGEVKSGFLCGWLCVPHTAAGEIKAKEMDLNVSKPKILSFIVSLSPLTPLLWLDSHRVNRSRGASVRPPFSTDRLDYYSPRLGRTEPPGGPF